LRLLDTLQTLQSLKLARLSSVIELADAQSKVLLAKPQYAAVLVPVLSPALVQLFRV
jgi:hypothetical protein